MKAKKIYYKKLISLGNYQNEEIGVELEIEEGETADDVLKAAKEFVERHNPTIGIEKAERDKQKQVSALAFLQKSEIDGIDKPDRINISEVAEITGLKKSVIYKHTCYDTIPYEKFAKRLVFSRKTIESWIETNTVKPKKNLINK